MDLEQVTSFWTADTGRRRQLAHWREHHADWNRPGREAREAILDLLGPGAFPLGKVVEWGVGGGSVAAALVDDSDEYVGVDIASDTLAAAEAAVDDPRFRGVCIDARDPEAAENSCGNADLFLSSWCYTHFPSLAYARRVTKIAARITSESGQAVVHLALNDAFGSRCTESYAGSFDRAGIMSTREAIDMAHGVGWMTLRIKRCPGGEFAWMHLRKR